MKPNDLNKALRLAKRIVNKRHLAVILQQAGWYDVTVKEFARELRKAYKCGLRDGNAMQA